MNTELSSYQYKNKFAQSSAAGRRLARRRTCSSPSAICGSASACAMLAVMDVDENFGGSFGCNRVHGGTRASLSPYTV